MVAKESFPLDAWLSWRSHAGGVIGNEGIKLKISLVILMLVVSAVQPTIEIGQFELDNHQVLSVNILLLSPAQTHLRMAPNPDWRSTNKSIQILAAAEAGKYGVLATVAYNIEHIIGMVRAAELVHSPLIIQFFPWAITFSSGLLIRCAADCAKRAKVPVAIHLDHAQDEQMIRMAAETLPFDSIMVDMSHFEKEENLRKTEALVRFCHERGIATEAEPGRIEGGEDGVMDTEGLKGSMTTTEEVRNFVSTGVEILAPAIGNMHGENPYENGDPNLDFER